MSESNPTKRALLHEPESQDGHLVFAESGLIVSARLINGRIQIEVHAAEDGALIAQTVIVLPKAEQPSDHQPDPAYPTDFYYPV
jgi:hypothetical protein